MRTCNEIVVAVLEESPVTEQELKLALIAYSQFANGAHLALRSVAQSPSAYQTLAASAEADAYWTMIQKPVDEWLGPKCTPGTPGFKAELEWARKVFKNATGKDIEDI